MDKLTQIIRTFDNYKIRHIDVLNNRDSKSRHTQLYQEILKGKVTSDEDAVRFLYGKDGNKNMPKYKTFKNEFKKRILNTMLFLDSSHEDFDEYQQAVYDANREWMTIRAASRSGMNTIALSLAENLLETVKRYEYTDIIIQILDLMKYCVAAEGNKKLFAEYQLLSEHYNAIWLAEQKAKDYASILKMEYVKTAEYKPYVSDIARTYFEELKPLLEKYDSFALHLYGRVVEIYIYSTINDYQNLLAVAERGLDYFKSKKFVVKAGLSVFLHQKMIASMMLKRYNDAFVAINQSAQLRLHGTFNWFKAQESKVSLCFRMHNYTEAYTIYQEVTTMPDFKKVLTGMSREIWYVFNAHFHLMHKLGAAQGLKLAEKEFDFDAFLKDTPTFNQDKKGMHLPLLILEICFQMSAKTRDELIDRIEAFQKHLTRYTDKTDPSYRFNEFGRMLLEIPKSGFKRSILESNTAQLFKNLQSVQYNNVESIYRSEVVELEELWELVLSNYESLK
jgi:hypothetical protein